MNTEVKLKGCDDQGDAPDDLYGSYKIAVHNHGNLVASLMGIAAKVASVEEINNALSKADPSYQALVGLIESKLNTRAIPPEVYRLVTALSSIIEVPPGGSMYPTKVSEIAIKALKGWGEGQ